jgi:hypothetical protein
VVAAEHHGVADLLVRCLQREGAAVVFGIPGEENIGFTDALARSPIRYVLVRHEQAASFMAEIYGRLTGRAGVCSATLGPGAINLLLGTADATTNNSPAVAVSAQAGPRRICKESHQNVDLVSMFAPVTKWADVVLTPGAVPEMVRKAFKLAQTERPGAVYLAVPEDVEAMAAPGLAPLNLNIPGLTCHRQHRSSGPRQCWTPPGARSCWQATGPPGRARRVLCGASPSSWACQRRPPSTARACSPMSRNRRTHPRQPRHHTGKARRRHASNTYQNVPAMRAPLLQPPPS